MSENSPSRRKVLQSIGFIGALSATGIAQGSTGDETDQKHDPTKTNPPGLDKKHKRPYDIGVVNNSEDNAKVKVKILGKDGKPIFDKKYNLPGLNGNVPDQARTKQSDDIDVSGDGLHTVEVSSGDKKTETDIYLFSEGPASYSVVSVYIHPGGALQAMHSLV